LRGPSLEQVSCSPFKTDNFFGLILSRARRGRGRGRGLSMFREKQTSNGSGIIFFALTCVCILAAAYREEGKGLFG